MLFSSSCTTEVDQGGHTGYASLHFVDVGIETYLWPGWWNTYFPTDHVRERSYVTPMSYVTNNYTKTPYVRGRSYKLARYWGSKRVFLGPEHGACEVSRTEQPRNKGIRNKTKDSFAKAPVGGSNHPSSQSSSSPCTQSTCRV